MKKLYIPDSVAITLNVLATVAIAVVGPLVTLVAIVILSMMGFGEVYTRIVILLCLPVFPLLIPVIWSKRRKKIFSLVLAADILLFGVLFGIKAIPMWYEESLTIDVTPNINTSEYLPFVEDSKIVKLENASLKLTGDLPVIDGATAAFPVYSAFVHAVYPETTRLYDGVFEYNNTVGGYRELAKRNTDLFLGAYPSKEQLKYAEACGTTFEFTQIGTEAFVFFVHKDNPIDSLTVEQIKGIYSGQITNWKEVGGADEAILPFQRDPGSGSQSMLLRFMGDTPVMEAETVEVQGMGAIIEEVADYQSRSGSIGFSFRFYVEGIIKNPDIKMIAIDGVAPNVENIKNGTYPVVAPVYAVTWAGNDNPNVKKLLDWILSEEGQYIIEETGYVGLHK